MKEWEAGFATWERPTLIAWGMQDRWLPFELVTALCQRIPKAQVVKLAQVGHYPQHDWLEKVQEAVSCPTLRKRELLVALNPHGSENSKDASL